MSDRTRTLSISHGFLVLLRVQETAARTNPRAEASAPVFLQQPGRRLNREYTVDYDTGNNGRARDDLQMWRERRKLLTEVNPRVRPSGCLPKKSACHQRIEQRVARIGIESPHSLNLLLGQLKAGDFTVLAADNLKPVRHCCLHRIHVAFSANRRRLAAFYFSIRLR
jgi:hypothetical protein